MNNYSYNEISKLNKKCNLNLNDEKIRILQHRLKSFNDMFHTLIKNIYDKKNFNKENLKENIFDNTQISLKKNELDKMILQIKLNSIPCSKYLNLLQKSKFVNTQYGGNVSNITTFNIEYLNNNISSNLFLKNLLNGEWIDVSSQFINIISNINF
ncbi:hypothetical protein CPAV1605_696 [seawater metagenome]|uniref:Uncharacterized protein n=1 Tax=seawater metagenome TaxID=1561972 RepID=A0A5E8CID8_9ZZZZ